MPTNEQRRATAKRKLERQLQRRAKRDERRRTLMIIGAIVGVVVLVAAVVTGVAMKRKGSEQPGTPTAERGSVDPLADAGKPGQLPAFTASPSLGADCQYPKTPEPASKPVKPPRSGKVPTDPAEVSVSMMTDQGPIGLMLYNGMSPCTVNSFVSLASQGFFKDTGCHRLTTAAALNVLQCGDPSGSGTGGPGYHFANEYPTDQYQPDDPARGQPVSYPRGVLAMAHSTQPDSNGSQFFLVYEGSELPPDYTVFGRIQDDGLATLDKIAEAGVRGGGEDGPPATKVTIKSVLLD